MGKRQSLFHQLLTSLRKQICFSESKYRAKQLAIAKAHAKGKSGFGVAPEGIYSVVTFAGYRQVAHQFAAWCTKNGYARTMEEARFWVPLYLEMRIDKELSAWTIQHDRSALRKIFRDPDLAETVEVPRRQLKNIKRSRHPVAMDQYFNEEKYPELVDFCNGTGLRRHELEAITPKDIYWEGNKLIAYVAQGKGGKTRKVTVVYEMKKRILEIVKGLDPAKPIFAHIPSRMDVHSYRAGYAWTRLHIDKAAELEVSKDLGHNRVDIMRCHYSRA